MSDVFRTFIVTAADKLAAIDTADEFPGGAEMFDTPLSPDGSLPATHYVSTGFVSEELADALAGCAGMDASDEEPFTAFARLGLVLVSDANDQPDV